MAEWSKSMDRWSRCGQFETSQRQIFAAAEVKQLKKVAIVEHIYSWITRQAGACVAQRIGLPAVGQAAQVRAPGVASLGGLTAQSKQHCEIGRQSLQPKLQHGAEFGWQTSICQNIRDRTVFLWKNFCGKNCGHATDIL